MSLVVINGPPGAGKDTFVECCKEILGNNCFNISTVDPIKEIAKICGWDGTKTAENRKFLSELKRVLTEWNNFPYRITMQRIMNYMVAGEGKDPSKPIVIFVHCREPEEIDKFKLMHSAVTLIVHRPFSDQVAQSNPSDANVFNYAYDYEVYNDGTIDDLRLKAQAFLNEL